MRPVEKVLEHVESYEERPNGYWCTCPAHEDHDPSLHLEEGKDGSALLVCRAGCEQEAVIAALEERGLKRRDLFATGADVVHLNSRSNGSKSSAKGRERLVKSYQVKDASGRLVATHERHEGSSGKRFLWRHPGGSYSKGEIRSAELPLYGSEHVADWPEEHGIVLVEGETPAEALRNLGIRALGTVTGASGTPDVEVLKDLVGRQVILWPDDDGPGRAHMRRVAELLQELSVAVHWFEWRGPESIKGP